MIHTRLFTSSVILIVSLMGEMAVAAETMSAGQVYVGIEGGLLAMNNFDPAVPGVSKTGFSVGATSLLRAGWQWRDHVRIDGQIGWSGANVDDLAGRIDLAYATANVYWDFSTPGTWVRPYLGAGLGVAGGWLSTNVPAATGPLARRSGVGLAYLFAGGGRFPLNDRWTLACAYQFLGTAALIDDGSGSTINPTMHAFMLGIHRSF